MPKREITSDDLGDYIKERRRQTKADIRGENAQIRSLKSHQRAMRIAEREEKRRNKQDERERNRAEKIKQKDFKDAGKGERSKR